MIIARAFIKKKSCLYKEEAVLNMNFEHWLQECGGALRRAL